MKTQNLLFKPGSMLAAFLLFASIPSTHAACPFNADGAGATSGTATTDGLLFLRHALGVTAGPALGANATQGSAAPATIASYIADPANKLLLDIDGDGDFTLLDSMFIARYLFGFRGDALTAGLPNADFAKRYGGLAMQTYIDNGCTGLNDLPDPRVTAWNAMNAALAAGNAASAKVFLTPNGLTNHGPAMDALLSQMSSIVGSYSPLIAKTISGEYAEYIVTRPLPGSATGEKIASFIIFLQAPSGAWLIDSM
jgi:hypothetical protein